MNVDLVSTMDVDKVWPLISQRIIDCVDSMNTDLSPGDMWTLCRSGAGFLVVVHDGSEIKAATIWRFETWPKGVVFRNLIVVGEDMASWIDACTKKVNEMAKQGGATWFAWQGRRGWERIFKNADKVGVYIMEVSP